MTNYLHEFKHCPLPAIGSLQLHPGEAQFVPGEKRIIAPIPFISLEDNEVPVDGLQQFIADKQNIAIGEAEVLLHNYCKQLQNLQAYEELKLENIGSFYMDENGKLHFKSSSLPAAYFPDVVAERVIHPDVAHSILVGDTHTNSTAMTEQLLQEEPVAKSRWWIAATVLAVAAIAIILVYYSSHGTGQTGTATKLETSPAQNTYRTP